MHFNLNPDQSKGTLTLEGEITLLQAQDLLTLLKEALAATDHVEIDIAELSDIDMAGLQLLCAAHKSAAKSNKRLTLNSNRPEAFVSRTRQAGLACRQICEGLNDTNCLWMGGTQ